MLVSSKTAVKGGHGFEIAVSMDNLRGGDWGEIQNNAHCVWSMHSRSTLFSVVFRRTGYFLPGGAVNHLPKKFCKLPKSFQNSRTETRADGIWHMKMAPYSFSGSIPAKFEHKLRRHKQTFGKITTTVVLDKDENLLWSGLQWHRSCYSNEMKPLPIILAAIFLSGNCSSKIDHRSFFLQ